MCGSGNSLLQIHWNVDSPTHLYNIYIYIYCICFFLIHMFPSSVIGHFKVVQTFQTLVPGIIVLPGGTEENHKDQ
jgi:hypothetical protein